jgi:outer membrane autotransporter protein
MTVDLAAGASDRLIIAGDATGAHRLLITGAGAMPSGNEPMATLVSIGGVNDTTFTAGGQTPGGTAFEGSFDYGAFNYEVQTQGHNIVIVNTGLLPAAYAPIRGVPGAQGILWFGQQDNISRRVGELRGPRNPGAGPDLWLRGGRARATLGGGDSDMRKSDVNFWNAEIGLDNTWQVGAGRVTLGAFVGVGDTSQKFRASPSAGSATGGSNLFGAGLYASWLADEGWFANATLSDSRYKNTFDAADLSGNRTTGDYKDHGLGAVLEAGYRLALARGWFVEPALQGAATSITRGDYTTGGAGSFPLDVRGSRVTISRLRAAVSAGRVWHDERVGWLQIAARAGLASERSTGGEISIGSSTRWRPNLDGDRCEAGLGLYWQPQGHYGQIYFDYDYATGDNYQKPWGLSLGFRMFFR